MKTFYIEAYDGRGDNCYIGYDNRPCISLDMAMTFDSEEEAEKAIKELQENWPYSLLKVNYVDSEIEDPFED